VTAPFLQIDSLEKRFGELAVTRGVSLSVARSEIVALLGPSGSGKTTVLRLVAGFETPDSGRIVVEGEDVTATAPERRRFGMVFQHYALFPHMTAGENVAFGLESQGMAAAEAKTRVAETLAAVELAGYENRRVTQLSGGQQQRVALARALANGPKLLLADEPTGQLDSDTGHVIMLLLRSIVRHEGITAIVATHDPLMLDVADRVFELRDGLFISPPPGTVR
jgi:ABC-type Fe3+/spermidine/putrescine transport system ATPase subunit